MDTGGIAYSNVLNYHLVKKNKLARKEGREEVGRKGNFLL